MKKRLQTTEKIYNCINAIAIANKNAHHDVRYMAGDVNSEEECRPLRDLFADDKGFDKKDKIYPKDINEFLVDNNFIPYDREYFDISRPDEILTKVLREKVLFYAKRDLELRTSQIPTIGSVIDVNDLWIVSAAIMSFLLYFLKKSYQQEIVNAKYIKNKFPDFFIVVKNTQVLVQFSSNKGKSGAPVMQIFGHVSKCSIFLLPSVIQLWLLWEEYKTYLIGKSINPAGNVLQYVLIFGTSLLLFVANADALKAHEELENLFACDSGEEG